MAAGVVCRLRLRWGRGGSCEFLPGHVTWVLAPQSRGLGVRRPSSSAASASFRPAPKDGGQIYQGG